MDDSSKKLKTSGRFAKILGGIEHFAKIELLVDFTAQEKQVVFAPSLLLEKEKHTKPFREAWMRGAEVGITFAMKQCNISSYIVTITKIEGTYVDTNPTIVGAAAIDAIWKLYHFEDLEKKNMVEEIVRASWKRSEDDVPDFSENKS